MDELERLRQKKAEELQRSMQEQAQIQEIENLVKSRLTKKAVQRYGNIKAAYPEKTRQLILVLAQIIQTRNIKRIDDNQLKSILKQLQPKKRDFKVVRK